ncbi:MAG: HD domain-containing protein [Bacilli bacterium]|nr:HD domain-containing protein [Bacilli bacterium]
MENIIDFKENTQVTTQMLVINVNKGMTNVGKPYMTITFQDSTGQIDGKKWDYTEIDAENFQVGSVVEVKVEVIKYRDALQLKVLDGKKLSNEEMDVAKLVPSAPVPKEELLEKLNSYLASIKNEAVSKVVSYLIDKHYKQYIEWPAAVRNHHNFVSGLMYHSLCMADVAEGVCKIYPSINRDVVIGTCLIHDLGKVIELSGPVATKFTLEGKLLGHISIGQAEVREACKVVGVEGEMAVILEHMILSHHTKPEYGSPVMPLTREALVMAMVDDLDAKMNILDKAYATVVPGEFTTRQMTMDDRYFYKPLYTEDK